MEDIGIFKKASESYEIFIPGETVDLVIPSLRAISQDNWHSWLMIQKLPATAIMVYFQILPKNKLIFCQVCKSQIAVG